MSKGLLLASGGIDSITAMYECDKNISHVLFLNYGQAVFKNELSALKKHSKKLNKILIVDNVKDLYRGFASPILDGIFDATLTFEIPHRNIVFVNYAVAKATVLNLSIVFTGIFQTKYADTKTVLYKQMNDIIAKSNSTVKIKNVFENFNKVDIIIKGVSYNIDLGKDTFSCYMNNSSKKHCGICSSCQMRRKSFIKAKVNDSTEYIFNNT